MAQTGLDVFDRTIQKSNNWINEIMSELEWDDKQKTYLAFKAVLHALRDRLTIEEVAHLGAQLPMLVRGIYYEDWRPSGKPIKISTLDEFFEYILEKYTGVDDINPMVVAPIILKSLSKRISKGEYEDIKSIVPRDIRELMEISED